MRFTYFAVVAAAFPTRVSTAIISSLDPASVFASRVKAHQSIGIGGKRFGQDLDSDVPIERGIARSVHFPHSARAERRNDFIGTETRAGRDSHEKLAHHTARSKIPYDRAVPRGDCPAGHDRAAAG